MDRHILKLGNRQSTSPYGLNLLPALSTVFVIIIFFKLPSWRCFEENTQNGSLGSNTVRSLYLRHFKFLIETLELVKV